MAILLSSQRPNTGEPEKRTRCLYSEVVKSIVLYGTDNFLRNRGSKKILRRARAQVLPPPPLGVANQ
ncbi:hypothetical protein K0M31_012824 [Melipona bicolor]|uniref:Uncharacterized protein n=1 Tax=Melipona bicolor TaxID=60889 RepID=A0AA40FJR7_9HYME|nr:hypothetical protein K0M31_012824 [Melipona bicolor]